MNTQRGTIIMLCGLPGSGKTTLAKKMEVERNAVRMSPDAWTDELWHDKSDTDERDRLHDLVEKIQWQTALRLVELGVTVILENGFWAREEREAYLASFRKIGAMVELHFLNVDKETLWKRLENRNNNLTPGTFHIHKHEFEEWSGIFQAPTQDELEMYDFYRVHTI